MNGKRSLADMAREGRELRLQQCPYVSMKQKTRSKLGKEGPVPLCPGVAEEATHFQVYFLILPVALRKPGRIRKAWAGEKSNDTIRFISSFALVN